MRTCKIDDNPLILTPAKNTKKKLTGSYYYSAYYMCPKCRRIYFDDKYKISNFNMSLGLNSQVQDDQEFFDIKIWTDGSSSNNGRPNAKAAWAFVAGEYEDAGYVDGKQTNNRGEALAVYYALLWSAEKNYKTICIYTDSQITIFGVAKHPERVKENRDIFQKIYDVVQRNDLQVAYKKVLGHSGDLNNERADKLAVKLSLA